MQIQDGYRMALAHCGCKSCTAELGRINAHLPQAATTLGGEDYSVSVVEPVPLPSPQAREMMMTHSSIGRTYPHRSARYNG